MNIHLAATTIALLALASTLAGCASDKHPPHTDPTPMTTNAPTPPNTDAPPQRIQEWMDRLTVQHAYDPDTGFIVARETIALPPILAGAPPLDEAIRLAAIDNRTVIAFATADRCAPCQQFKKDALNDPRVLALLADQRIITTHIEVDRQPNLAETHLGSRGIPMTYALRDAQPIATLRGQRSPEELIAWLEQVLRAEG
ncbi:MAG: thioredoxin family protein [Phycisphaerales bacterium]